MIGHFRSLLTAPRRPSQAKPLRPTLETLEERDVPATITVTGNGDTVAVDGQVTLREAIQSINAGSPANADVVATGAFGTNDTIQFASSLSGQTITLSGTQLSITKNVTITGPGATNLTISGNNASRIFDIGGTSTTASIFGLTLTKGHGSGQGGAIEVQNGDTLTVSNSVITGNTATGGGGGIEVYSSATLKLLNSSVTNNQTGAGYDGGGLYATSSTTVTIQNCTISGNTSGNDGGGVYTVGTTLTISNSTISGNTAKGNGGGVLDTASGTTMISNTTIANNTVSTGSYLGGGIDFGNGTGTLLNCTITGNSNNSSGGGGVGQYSGTLTLQNTIVAGNTDSTGANDVHRTNGTLNATNSLFQTTPTTGSGNTINGTNTANLFGTNPNLGSLKNNGGTVQTEALLSGSPAIDAGGSPGSLTTDERGSPFVRVFGSAADIGAFEAQTYATTTVVVSSLNPSAPGQAVTFTATVTSASAGSVQGTVTFLDGATPLGTVALTNGTATLALSTLAAGSHSITVQYNGFTQGDAQVYAASTSAVLTQVVSTPPSTVAVGASSFAVGSGGGALGQVSTFSLTGTLLSSTNPFPGYNGPLSVATGDVNHDGTLDLIVATLIGSSHVKVFSGTDGSLLYSFFAFPGFSGGASVAAGDVNGDGFADIVVGAGPGGSGHMKVFSGQDGSLLMSFFAYPGYTGAVSVAAADVNGDGHADIVTGSTGDLTNGLFGAYTAPSHVKVFSGLDGSVLQSFYAFPGTTGGVNVAAGDLTGSGHAEIVVGAANGSSQVATFDGQTGAQLLSFQAFTGFAGGVRVGVSGRNIIAGAGPGAGPHVKLFDGAVGTLQQSFYAFDPVFVSGVFVG